MTTRAVHKTPSRVAGHRAPSPSSKRTRLAHPRSVPIEAAEFEDGDGPDQPFAEGAIDAIDPDLRHRLISEAAYNFYQARGYEDGYDVDDWLEAEATIDHTLVGRAGA